LRRWAVYFFNCGHQVDIITLNEMEADDYGGANIHVVKKKFSGGGAAARMFNFLPPLQECNKICKRIRPDLLHGQDAGGTAWRAALFWFHPLWSLLGVTYFAIPVKKILSADFSPNTS
jgi:hypothetical protein